MPFLPPFSASYRGLANSENPDIQQNPAAPRNSRICPRVVGTGMAQTACFLLAPTIHLPWVILKPKYLTSCGQICAFFFDTWYPASASSLSRALVPSQHWVRVGLASRRSSTYWRRAHHKSHPRNLVKSDVSAPLKNVGEFLNPCGSLVQVNCSFALVVGFSHSKANRGWLLGTSWRQKKVSFKSR